MLARIKAALVIAVLVAVGGLLVQHSLAAGTSNIYVTPASQTVVKGNSFNVQIRINPTTAVDTVVVKLGYTASYLQYNSTTLGAFANCITNSGGGGVINLTCISTSGGVSASQDSLIATINFTAETSTLSSPLTFDTTGTNTVAAYAGANVPITATNGSVSFVPVPVTSPTTTTGSTGSSGSSGSASSGGTKKSTSSSSTTPAAAAAPAASAPVTPPVITPADANVQYSQAIISLTTDTPTTAYLLYGTSPSQLTNSTTESSLGTSHQLTLDPSLLTPGTTYYYQIVATNQSGGVTKTTVKSLQTKGLTVNLVVTDKNHKPLKNATVILHSAAITAKTNDKGVVTFTNVTAGSHHLLYGTGSKQISQALTVSNNVETNGTSQTSGTQNVAVVLNTILPGSHESLILICLLVLVVVVVLFVFRRQLLSLPGRAVPHEPASVLPVQVVTGSANTPPTVTSTASSEPPVAVQNTGVLTPQEPQAPETPAPDASPIDHVEHPETFAPGTTIQPKDPNDQDDQAGS